METLVPEKEKVLSYVNEENVVELAKNVIKIPSPTESENDMATFLEKYMKDNGLETEMVEVESGRFQPIGRIKGTGGGYSLIFNGHMDTDVLWMGIQDPFVPKIEGNKLYGHGIYNMKSGLSSMIEAAIAIRKSGVRLKGDLIVTPVVGELQGGVGTVFNIIRGVIADYGLVPEPKGEFSTLTHAGVEGVAITIKGRSEHISRMEEGINLSVIMAEVIDSLNNIKFTYEPDPRHPGLPRSIIASAVLAHGEEYDLKGDAFLPDICTIIVNARFIGGMCPHKDIEKVLEKIKSKNPEFDYEMQVTPDDPRLPGLPWKNWRITMPFQDLSPDELIVKVHAQNYKHLTGKEANVGAMPVDHPHHKSMRAGDDDAHLTKAGCPSFICGPGGDWRGPGGVQYTEIDSMVRVAKNFVLTAYDICTTLKK